jgi:cell wall assembly regulator SMI1
MRQLDFEESQPPVSGEELAAAEAALAELGHRIPPSYREFLAAHDGGPPVQDRFEFDDVDGRRQRDRVHYFLGVADSPDGDLVETAGALHGRLIPGMLPIAGDEYGNLLLLDARGDADGPVWFWDHEREGDTPDVAALALVAPDLETFLHDLAADE